VRWMFKCDVCEALVVEVWREFGGVGRVCVDCLVG
jgi:hypothetical protein